MQKQLANNSNPSSPGLPGVLGDLIGIAMLGLPIVAAYQAGYVILPICLIAWLPSIFVLKFFAYLLNIPFDDWKKHCGALIPFIFLTSSLLQNSILVLLISCFILASIYLVPPEPHCEKPELSEAPFFFHIAFCLWYNLFSI